MRNFDGALEKLIEGFEGFTNSLRGMAVEDKQANADDGEEVYDFDPVEDNDDAVVELPRGQNRDGITDDTEIHMRSGELRKVIDSYRKLSRYAREGRIPTQEQRFKLHQAVKDVKHLIRTPRR
jgi:hypothetical protein